ncbi:hypothetical protein GQ44DRAFT_774776 [Phaeosphaeriaceae sp. PMI808]|nr:hypothetical protein GQ44DRAFT_774776 [Phaeosphaeriaceae sp. PMI808]
MVSKTLLVSLMIAYVQARFGQEQVPIAAISAVQGGAPGAAATIAGATISDLLGAANACAKLSRADQIVTELGGGADAIAAAIGLVAAEKNTNPFAGGNAQNVCGDASLPATAALRGITPLIDPAVDTAGGVAALSQQTSGTPLDATGKSVFDLLTEAGFGDLVVAQNAAGGAAAGGAAAGGAAAGNANQGNAAAGNANAGAAAGNANAGNNAAAGNANADAAAGNANADAGMANAGNNAAAGNANQAKGKGKKKNKAKGKAAGAGAGAGNANMNNDQAKNNAGNAGAGNAAAGNNANADNANAGNAAAGNNANQAKNNAGNAGAGNNANQANGNAGNAGAGAAAGGAAAGGAADFGNCAQPTITFQGGEGNRPATEFTFQIADATARGGQGEALNPNIITNALCNNLTNFCNANAAAKAKCEDAKAQVQAAGTRDKSTADLFNTAIGFPGAVTNPAGGPANAPAAAGAARRMRRGMRA